MRSFWRIITMLLQETMILTGYAWNCLWILFQHPLYLHLLFLIWGHLLGPFLRTLVSSPGGCVLFSDCVLGAWEAVIIHGGVVLWTDMWRDIPKRAKYNGLWLPLSPSGARVRGKSDGAISWHGMAASVWCVTGESRHGINWLIDHVFIGGFLTKTVCLVCPCVP